MALHKCSCNARYPDDLATCPQCGKATPAPVDVDAFDPGDHNVDDVVAFIAAHPEAADRVIAAEKDGKARKTILEAGGEGSEGDDS